MIEALAPGWKTEIVPRIPSIITGINQTRQVFKLCYFVEVHCSVGLSRLELYRKEWDNNRSCYRDTPRHDDNSNGSDAFRQFAQALTNKQLGYVRIPSDEIETPWRDRLNKKVKKARSGTLRL